MYAIIECGGKQYRVSEGDVVRVEKIDAVVGSIINIDKVLMLGGDTISIGSPLVEGAVVSCKVLNHDKDKKIMVFHYKPKKNIRKRYGHRQPFTSLLVESISDSQGSKPAQKVVSTAVEDEMAVTAEPQPAVEAIPEARPVKKAAAKKAETAEPAVEKKVKKTATKKAETTAKEKPAKKAAAKVKDTIETEG